MTSLLLIILLVSCDPVDGDVGVSCDDTLLNGVDSLVTAEDGLAFGCPGN